MSRVSQKEMEKWVNQVMITDGHGGFYVDLEPYDSRRGYDGKVWAVYFRTVDMLRRFHWLAQVGEQFEVIDKGGSKVTDRLVSLPNMRNIPKKGDDHKRKVYLSGVGTTNSEELGKHLVAQEEVIKTPWD